MDAVDLLITASFGTLALDGHPEEMPEGKAVPWKEQGGRYPREKLCPGRGRTGGSRVGNAQGKSCALEGAGLEGAG